jgi:hypothetical protein
MTFPAPFGIELSPLSLLHFNKYYRSEQILTSFRTYYHLTSLGLRSIRNPISRSCKSRDTALLSRLTVFSYALLSVRFQKTFCFDFFSKLIYCFHLPLLFDSSHYFFPCSYPYFLTLNCEAFVQNYHLS